METQLITNQPAPAVRPVSLRVSLASHNFAKRAPRCLGWLQGLVEIGTGFSTRGYPARPLRRFVRSPGHQSRVVPRCRRARALSCSRRRHTVVLSSGVACSAHGEQRGGSVRRLRTRRGDGLVRSPAMPRPPPSMMPSLRRTCGRPSCSSAAICRLAAAGKPQDQ